MSETSQGLAVHATLALSARRRLLFSFAGVHPLLAVGRETERYGTTWLNASHPGTITILPDQEMRRPVPNPVLAHPTAIRLLWFAVGLSVELSPADDYVFPPYHLKYL